MARSSFPLKFVILIATLNATIAAGANASERRNFGSWEVVCEGRKNSKKICAVVQSIVSSNDDALRLTTVISFDQEEQEFGMKITTPLGLALREGIGLQVDNKQLGVMNFTGC